MSGGMVSLGPRPLQAAARGRRRRPPASASPPPWPEGVRAWSAQARQTCQGGRKRATMRCCMPLLIAGRTLA
eukprot:2016759-Pleurochrysis_carterae.AAC.1